MTAILLCAALTLLPATAAFAQASPAPAAPQATVERHHGNKPHKAAVRMGKELNLSADQQARLEPILAERRDKMAAVRANPQLSDADRHQQIKAIKQGARSEMGGVLSPDQMQQLKSMHRGRHAEPAAPAGA